MRKRGILLGKVRSLAYAFGLGFNVRFATETLSFSDPNRQKQRKCATSKSVSGSSLSPANSLALAFGFPTSSFVLLGTRRQPKTAKDELGNRELISCLIIGRVQRMLQSRDLGHRNVVPLLKSLMSFALTVKQSRTLSMTTA